MKSYRQLIRPAVTQEERRAIYDFRYRTYIEEMGKPYLNADHANRLLSDSLDTNADVILLYASIGQQIIGTLRTIIGCDPAAKAAYCGFFSLSRFQQFPDSEFSFSSRFMIHPQYRRSHLAVDLVEHIYRVGRERNVQFNFASCAPNLARFYERLGFRQYKQPMVDCDAGPQIPLVLLLEDIEHLNLVDSPFKQEAMRWANSPRTRLWFNDTTMGERWNTSISTQFINNAGT